jgi:hypothetical protein
MAQSRTLDDPTPWVCRCDTPQPEKGWGNGCRSCSRPIVALMAPAAREALIRKDPTLAPREAA